MQCGFWKKLTGLHTGIDGYRRCGIRKKLTGLHTGIDGYWRCGIRQNTVRDSEKVNGIRELNAAGEEGFDQNTVRDSENGNEITYGN